MNLKIHNASFCLEQISKKRNKIYLRQSNIRIRVSSVVVCILSWIYRSWRSKFVFFKRFFRGFKRHLFQTFGRFMGWFLGCSIFKRIVKFLYFQPKWSFVFFGTLHFLRTFVNGENLRYRILEITSTVECVLLVKIFFKVLIGEFSLDETGFDSYPLVSASRFGDEIDSTSEESS